MGFRNGGFLNPPRYVLATGCSLPLCELQENTWSLELSHNSPHEKRDEYVSQFIQIWNEKNGLASCRDRSRSPPARAGHGSVTGHPVEPDTTRKATAQCFMPETQFRTHDGQLVFACDLSVGDTVLDHRGREASVTWCQKHA